MLFRFRVAHNQRKPVVIIWRKDFIISNILLLEKSSLATIQALRDWIESKMGFGVCLWALFFWSLGKILYETLASSENRQELYFKAFQYINKYISEKLWRHVYIYICFSS